MAILVKYIRQKQKPKLKRERFVLLGGKAMRRKPNKLTQQFIDFMESEYGVAFLDISEDVDGTDSNNKRAQKNKTDAV